MLDRSSNWSEGVGGKRSGGGSLRKVATARLAAEILQCELVPGTFVSEAGLSARFGLGKAPVRAALAALAARGLIEAFPRRGYRVAPVRGGDLADLFDLRLRLEPTLADAELSSSDLADLERLDGMLDASARAEDPAARRLARQVDRECLVILAEAAGNPRLTRCLLDAHDLCVRAFVDIRRRGGPCLGLMPRGEIIAHLRCGAADAARAATAERLERLAGETLRALAALDRPEDAKYDAGGSRAVGGRASSVAPAGRRASTTDDNRRV